MMRKSLKNGFLNSITYVILIFSAFWALVPLAWILSTSIKPVQEIYTNPPRWIPNNPTLGNYVNVMFDSNIPGAYWNSFLIGLGTALLALLLGGSAGYAFARFRFRGSKFLSLFILISQMLPVTVLMVPMFYMGNDLGLIDTRIGLTFAHLVIAMPLVTWMSKGYFQSIPVDIEEAARVDGCGTLRTLVSIVLPLLRPALAATGIYAFVSSWNEFALANVLTRTMASRTVPVTLSEFSTFFRVNWGDTMAAAMVITVPVVIVFMTMQKYFVSGLSSGAVKG